jgi:hypothetical protein
LRPRPLAVYATGQLQKKLILFRKDCALWQTNGKTIHLIIKNKEDLECLFGHKIVRSINNFLYWCSILLEIYMLGEAAAPEVVSLPKTNPPANAAPTNSSKTAAQAKAAYSYPWWASENPIEVFWGQVNEPVQIVPVPKYIQSAKAAMGREVFEQELAEPQALLDE